MKGKFLILSIFFSFVLFPNFLDYDNLGNFADCVDAGYFSLGNTFIFSPFNPSIFNGTMIMLGGGFTNSSEERSVWVFDSYNNTIGKSVISKNTYQNFGQFGFLINGESEMFRFGFNYSPFILTNYKFYDVKMDEFYVITSEQEIKKDISISGYTPNFGIRKGILSAGFSVSILRGNYYYYEKTDRDTFEEDKNYSGLTFGGGISLKQGKDLDISFYYNHDISVRSDSDSIVYPRSFSIGLKYTPKNILPVTFIGEFDYEFWNNTKVNGEEKDYDNIFGLKFGVQHKLASNLFARFGYAYKRHYSQNVAIGLFTFGVGWEHFKTNFDLGIGIENLNFKKDETFYNELTTKFKLSVRRSL